MTLTTEPTRFDSIASAYADYGTENTPIRRYAETYTVLRHAQPLTGAHVLDAACSDGFFSRLLHAAGAATVHGLDLSAPMIDVARQKTSSDQISYAVGNVLNLGQTKPMYDFVMSSFAQSYATNTHELQEICNQFFAQLKPGGRILTLNDNPTFRPEKELDYRKYGKSKKRNPSQGDGSVIDVCWYCKDKTGEMLEIPFSCHYYARETLIDAFVQAGFVNVTVHDTEVSPEGLAAFASGYWDLLQDHSLFCVITADKPAA